MMEANKSIDEWIPSEITATDPVKKPIINFKTTITKLLITERIVKFFMFFYMTCFHFKPPELFAVVILSQPAALGLQQSF
ncbi:hypothetical protein MAQA_02472 [Listeria aquatica FSL S10-1188]|uniref:Uncharacterized protein n=1 Tax=Listeria aquatica FSL S10-1188 TaxID=1265818 RepID=W7BA29_9LIST|nr:hypothetical protein MAQA_02472 [Listeria aquatica FSL S10-1188]